MYNLIVYGSLINKKELKNEGISLNNVELVKVYGFKRVFNQEPSYRFVNSVNRAVLNIEEEKASWFNAIVIKNLSDKYFETLNKRERGYFQMLLDDDCVKTYSNTSISNCVVYKGKLENRDNKIMPNLDYLEICLEGVESFGKEFIHDFIRTTFKNSKKGWISIN